MAGFLCVCVCVLTAYKTSTFRTLTVKVSWSNTWLDFRCACVRACVCVFVWAAYQTPTFRSVKTVFRYHDQTHGWISGIFVCVCVWTACKTSTFRSVWQQRYHDQTDGWISVFVQTKCVCVFTAYKASTFRSVWQWSYSDNRWMNFLCVRVSVEVGLDIQEVWSRIESAKRAVVLPLTLTLAAREHWSVHRGQALPATNSFYPFLTVRWNRPAFYPNLPPLISFPQTLPQSQE